MKSFLRLLFIFIFILIISGTSGGVVSDISVTAGNIAQAIPPYTASGAQNQPASTPQSDTGLTPSDPPPTLPAATPYVQPVITNLPENIINPYRKSYASAYNSDGTLSSKSLSWSFRRNKEHQPPEGYFDMDIRQFGGYYLGDISQQVVYLTFDCGYEFGFTPLILDTLKEKGVKATFFVTKAFIESDAALCIRMKEEGHLVANHSANHKNSSTLTMEEMKYEINECARLLKEKTGYEMDKFFRFPEGVYTMATLNAAYETGYKSIFWSLAYMDWDENAQPGKKYAFDHVTTYFHNGCIALLHSKSESNTQALGDIIDHIHSSGFTFATLDNLN